MKKEEVLFSLWKKYFILALEVEVCCRIAAVLLTKKSYPLWEVHCNRLT